MLLLPNRHCIVLPKQAKAYAQAMRKVVDDFPNEIEARLSMLERYLMR
jgi:phosphoribosyl-dephospho-CoA transferase